MKRFTMFFCLAMVFCLSYGQNRMRRFQPHFKMQARMAPADWFATAEARQTADTILVYQFPSGGWAKNHRWNDPNPDDNELHERAGLKQAMLTTGIGSTIDNDATTSEILFLAKTYNATGEEKYRQAAIKGVRYLLNAQYKNGGWPQFWPSRGSGYDNVKPYADHITFNDDAMVNTMCVLWSIARNEAPYDCLKLSDQEMSQCQQAFDKGVECILNCQMTINGELTVWCQQHDEVTLAPAHARAYELPSYCSAESASIVKLLMELPNPDERVRKAVDAAMRWFEKTKITGYRYKRERDADGQWNAVIVKDETADKLLWARFYDLEQCQPFFCDRDGIPRRNLSDIGSERRNGYGWYNDKPQDLFPIYDKWKK